jgi:MFS family permease
MGLVLIFALTIFVSAFLLFQVQPLISKFILPWFGGSPAVWTTCMLFFQVLLFGGYAYAHFVVKQLSPVQQGRVHLGVLTAALIMVGTALVLFLTGWTDRLKPTDSSYPIARIMLLLGWYVGLPYFMLSATGPLLQAWFARSFPGRSPYRLYALSNIGSLLALISYPFIVEPLLDTRQQFSFWVIGFVAFVLLCGYTAVHIWRLGRREAEYAAAATVDRAQLAEEPSERFALRYADLPAWVRSWLWVVLPSPVRRFMGESWIQRLLWLALPAFASMMLLATTNHVCQDISPTPFLWVVPLSLYLLSFIICFDHERWYIRPLFAIATLVFVYLSAAAPDFDPEVEDNVKVVLIDWTKTKVEEWRKDYVMKSVEDPSVTIPYRFNPEVGFIGELVLHFGALFCICMVCHGELVRLRPPPRHLTKYFLLISAGGALGGIFVSLIAPRIFNTYMEWRIGLMAAVILSAITLVWSTGIFQHFDDFSATTPPPKKASASQPRRWSFLRWAAMLFAFAVPWLILSGVAWSDMTKLLRPSDTNVVRRERNFYGTLRIEEKDTEEGPQLRLFNGQIIHGAQFTDENRWRPTTYYSPESGVGRAIKFFTDISDEDTVNDRSPRPIRVGAVGLGGGTLAAYASAPGRYFRFYEINPIVIDIAETDFTFVKDARAKGGKIDYVLGDARLSMEQELAEGGAGPQQFDVLALDAFSGDAIPAHLLTLESFEIYLKHLDINHGVIAVHISNRYVDLNPVVRGLAEHFGINTVSVQASGDSIGGYTSTWVLMTNNKEVLDQLGAYNEFDHHWNPATSFYASRREDLTVNEKHKQIDDAIWKLRNWPKSVLWTDSYHNLFELMMPKD